MIVVKLHVKVFLGLLRLDVFVVRLSVGHAFMYRVATSMLSWGMPITALVEVAVVFFGVRVTLATQSYSLYVATSV